MIPKTERIRMMRAKGMSEKDATKMAHMKRSKGETEKSVENPPSTSKEDYPYGLRLDLDNATLKKLGMKKMPKAGDSFEIEGKAKVVRTSTSSEDGEGDHSSCCLQITHLKVE